MRTVPALLLAIATVIPAAAQSVIVNQPGGQVLYDPGTGQERVVPPLLQPWQDDAIKLRPPGKHRKVHRAATSTTTTASTADTTYSTESETPPPPRKVKRTKTATTDTTVAETPRKTRRTAAASPPPPTAPQPQQSAPINGFSDFTDLITAPASAPAAAPAPKKSAPVKTATIAPAPKKTAVETPRPVETPRVEKPVQKASIEKPAKSHTPSGTPRETIAFSPNASDPSSSAVATVRTLAGNLSSALSDANARVQLMAYAGMKGEKSSDTRRLSLKRALVIRQLLIDDGIPSERIDVFALGGAEDSGPLDRVDVFVKS